jgi:BON domain-containing protein
MMNVDIAALEQAIEEIVEVNTALEVDGDKLVVTGTVHSPEVREAVLDTLDRLAPGAEVVDNLVIGAFMPEEIGNLAISETEAVGFAGAQPGLQDPESIEPGDFTDQRILDDPAVASGPTGTYADDDLAEGDEVYVPPTDPPRAPDAEFLGGFQTTADEDQPVPRSEVVGGPADGAIEEAVRIELREDAATAGMELQVSSAAGIVYLRGTVDDLDDAENAEAVASRVPGVREVREELQLRASEGGRR